MSNKPLIGNITEPYFGGQVVHQCYDGVLEVGARGDGSLGGLCDILGPLWPHQLEDILITVKNK